MKKYFLFLSVLFFASAARTQTSVVQQLGVPSSMIDELTVKEDSLRAQFSRAGLVWPAYEVYIRSFKYDSQLEVWVRNNSTDPFKLFKTYSVCVMAGSIGPKRVEGDYQVPEGFYYITLFNPRSEYHLSLKLNYPNESDQILSAPNNAGDGIYIHGNCVSVGCIPLQDDQIDEVYLIAYGAHINGQTYVPVHVFPVRFNNPKSVAYYTKYSFEDVMLQHFTSTLKPMYDYFEQTHQLPLVGILKSGDYELLN